MDTYVGAREEDMLATIRAHTRTGTPKATIALCIPSLDTRHRATRNVAMQDLTLHPDVRERGGGLHQERRESRLLVPQGRRARACGGAQYSLGFMYVNGEDDAQALIWFRKAAEQGDARSQALLGGMYHQGQGVPRDDVQAYAWFSLAAAQGNATAKRGKDIVAGTMTDEQIAKAQALSRKFWED